MANDMSMAMEAALKAYELMGTTSTTHAGPINFTFMSNGSLVEPTTERPADEKAWLRGRIREVSWYGDRVKT